MSERDSSQVTAVCVCTGVCDSYEESTLYAKQTIWLAFRIESKLIKRFEPYNWTCSYTSKHECNVSAVITVIETVIDCN